MQYLLLFLLLFLTFTQLRNKPRAKNPLLILALFWLLLTVLSIFRFYDTFEVSQQAYYIISIGITSIFSGYYLSVAVFSQKDKHNANKIPRCIYIPNYKLLIACNLAIIAFYIARFPDIIELLAAGTSWWHIRLMVANTGDNPEVWGSGLNVILYTYILAPIMYLILPVAIADFASSRKFGLLQTTTTIASILFVVGTVSRNLIVFAILYFVFCELAFNDRRMFKRYYKRHKKKIVAILLLLIIGLVIMTTIRKDEVDYLREAYVYLVGGLISLGNRLTDPISQHLTYGLLTTRGLTRPFFIIANALGFGYPEIYLQAGDVLLELEHFQDIGSVLRMNAYTTMFYHFFVDGRYVGLVLFCGIFGMICQRVAHAIRTRPNVYNMTVYLLLIQQIFFSMARIYTVFPTRALTYIYIVFVFRRIVAPGNRYSNSNQA